MANWKLLLEQALTTRCETFDDIVECTLSESELLKEFDDGYGVEEGEPFTVWTSDTVYFPVCYDGSEWVGSVSRNPDGKPTHHQGF